MANIPGATNVLPGVFTDIITQSRGVSVPGGSRITAMIGEGSTDETLVSQAQGGGLDGLNTTYTSASGRDGRHFLLSNAPLVSNRTTLFKNGIPLVGKEELISTSAFSNAYDYRIDITTGQIELQTAHLLDQGGAFFTTVSTNVGTGTVGTLALLDVNAQPETWTLRCVSVQRTALNAPIAGTASFIAFGSISGAKLDANGNSIVWISNGTAVSNGILNISLSDTGVGMTAFREGDAFTIIVASGVLVRNDSLTANYIPSAILNDPLLLQGLGSVVRRHGLPGTGNNLSLGAQLAFANNAPAILTVQAAPAMPRRTSYVLDNSVNANALNDSEFIYPLPAGVTPDFNSNIHFFVKNNTTNVETQILPNKFPFYTLDTSGKPSTHTFIFDDAPAPGGNSYAYTINQSFEAISFGQDGYIGRTYPDADGYHGTFSSPSVAFDATYVGKALKITEATNSANFGVFNIASVSNGKLNVVADATHFATGLDANSLWLSDFITENSVTFAVINPVTGLQVASNAGTNGALVSSGASTGDGYMSSATIDFSSITSLTSYKLRITGSTVATLAQPVGNNGLYDIDGYTGTGINIKKAIVNESAMTYEVLDASLTSDFVVVNHNVVPNGYALRVSIVDTRDATFYDAGWLAALTSLESVECDILVPLPKQTISVIFQNALSHCLTMSNIRNKKERVLFIGAISGLTPDNLTGAKLAAVEDIGVLEGIQGETVTDVLAGNVEDLANYSVPDAFGNTYRAVYFYPDQIVVQAGTENVLIDGFYLAAAAAGYESADVRLENPLTNKVLSGFTILRNKQFSPQTLEALASAGVTTLQPVAGGGRIVWGLTTSQSGYPEEQEISIVFIRDRVAKTLRAGFQGFIGLPETPNTGAILNTRGVILLNSLVSQGLITQYKDLAVVKDDVDPRQWNITVRVQPTYPVNFIYIKVSLGTI